MANENKILDASNQIIEVTNFLTPNQDRTTLSGLPLGTVGNSTTGEVLLKVSIREGGGGSPITNYALESGGNLDSINNFSSNLVGIYGLLNNIDPNVSSIFEDTDILVTNSNILTAGNAFSNITTATTTQVKALAGVLVSVQINTIGAGTSTITIYDATSGTTNKICGISGLTLGSFQFNVAVSNGIRVVTVGSVTAPDITVIYR